MGCGDAALEAGFWGSGGSFLVAGVGGGRKPTRAGREAGPGLDLVGIPAGGGTSCVTGPDACGA